MKGRKLVLVGGGHAHIEVMRRWPALCRAAGEKPCDALLISPDRQAVYSGMIPGLLAGHYQLSDCCVDLKALSRHCQFEFVQDEVVGIDTAGSQSHLRLKSGGFQPYDLLSLDIGSTPSIPKNHSQHPLCPAKPALALWQNWQDFLNSMKTDSHYRIHVVGSGVAGVELILAMQSRLQQAGFNSAQCHFCLIGKGVGQSTLLAGHNHRVQQRALAVLQQRGIQLRSDVTVQAFSDQHIVVDKGELLPSDLTVMCTTAKAANWLPQTGLPLNETGFIQVDASLQVAGFENVFACGDIAAMTPPLAKAGVYPVRQGPILAHNLFARYQSSGDGAASKSIPLQAYVPQTRFLSLIATGDKKAMASRGWFYAFGRWVWYWKDHIDRGFMRRYQSLYSTEDASPL